MQVCRTSDGFVVETALYVARYRAGPPPVIEVRREDRRMFRLPATSGLATVDQPETLAEVTAGPAEPCPEGLTLALSGRSSLWSRRWFRWSFHEDRIEHRHGAAGAGRPGRCFFFSNGPQDAAADAASAPGHGPLIETASCFTPASNMAGEHLRMLGIPQSLGILPEVETPFAYGVPDRVAMIFAPPPLCLMLGEDDRWSGLGLGAPPGDYHFNALEFTGAGRTDGLFYVNYLGYQEVKDEFSSPVAALHFGFNPYQVLERHVAWLDEHGFSTRHRHENPPWHRLPIFCGWGEQCCLAERLGGSARDQSTQRNYEAWMQTLEERGLPVGTVVIDDKWQQGYGSFLVDEAKWPDLAGFIARQHARGRHVLLWVPTYHTDGLPAALCIHDRDRAIAADVSDPAYEELLRDRVRHLVHELGVDGFKVDWVWGITRRPGLRTHAPLHGIEWLRRFQHILYDETHRWRPDALVETHSTHPLFRESSDVLRLNDLHRGARRVVEMMAMRARIARICGWRLVDCDAAPFPPLSEWWSYMEAQPAIGIPALYCAGLHAPADGIPGHYWERLRQVWTDYLADLGA